MVELSPRTQEFVQEVFPATVGTKWPNGEVHMTPIWFEYRDGYFWLNSFRGSKWLENAEREGTLTLSLVDPKNMFRFAEVRGKLIETSDEHGADHIDQLALRYTGQKYTRHMPGQQRVRIQVEPTRVRGSLDWQPPS